MKIALNFLPTRFPILDPDVLHVGHRKQLLYGPLKGLIHIPRIINTLLDDKQWLARSWHKVKISDN